MQKSFSCAVLQFYWIFCFLSLHGYDRLSTFSYVHACVCVCVYVRECVCVYVCERFDLFFVVLIIFQVNLMCQMFQNNHDSPEAVSFFCEVRMKLLQEILQHLD